MPISSGALDWPVSYYTKPAHVETISDGPHLDPWSHEHAYKHWSWKTKRGKRRKRKENPDEKRRHRRRCCCCVLWWLTALFLILLALILFMVFWIRERAHDLPPVNPDDRDKLNGCKGYFWDTYVYYDYYGNQTWYECCYNPPQEKVAALRRNGKFALSYSDGPDCEDFCTDAACEATQLKVSTWTIICLVCINSLL